jgi:hypothetical protein
VSKKPTKHEKQLQRQKRPRLVVRCDACSLVQPFSRGDGSRHANGAQDVAGCIVCGWHYGTYA